MEHWQGCSSFMCLSPKAGQLLTTKTFSDLCSLPRSLPECLFMMGFSSSICYYYKLVHLGPEHLGCILMQRGVIVKKTYSVQLKVKEDNALNEIWKLWVFFFSLSPAPLKTLPLFQQSEQSFKKGKWSSFKHPERGFYGGVQLKQKRMWATASLSMTQCLWPWWKENAEENEWMCHKAHPGYGAERLIGIHEHLLSLGNV